MSDSVRKYNGFNRNERTITGGATNQFASLVFNVDDDCTAVGVHVEVALGPEAPTDGNTQGNVAGFARVVVNRMGNVRPVVVPSLTWNAATTEPDGVLNDADVGDTWAIVPFSAGAGIVSTAIFPAGAAVGWTQTGLHLVLSPKTKRKLRRGDTVEVEIQYSNGAPGNLVIQEAVVGTLFVTG